MEHGKTWSHEVGIRLLSRCPNRLADLWRMQKELAMQRLDERRDMLHLQCRQDIHIICASVFTPNDAGHRAADHMRDVECLKLLCDAERNLDRFVEHWGLLVEH